MLPLVVLVVVAAISGGIYGIYRWENSPKRIGARNARLLAEKSKHYCLRCSKVVTPLDGDAYDAKRGTWWCRSCWKRLHEIAE